jgi:hypothetical protein
MLLRSPSRAPSATVARRSCPGVAPIARRRAIVRERDATRTWNVLEMTRLATNTAMAPKPNPILASAVD